MFEVVLSTFTPVTWKLFDPSVMALPLNVRLFPPSFSLAVKARTPALPSVVMSPV
jgi:hypothetical protein